MLIDVTSEIFREHFPIDPHPFVSEPFIELNKGKVEKVIRLIDFTDKPIIGLVAGINKGVIQSPFSAPFGGFHFRHETVYISEIDRFIDKLKKYITMQGLERVQITMPPDIYHLNFNAKTINSFIRSGFLEATPEITNWVDLEKFSGVFTQKNSREYYRQAVRNDLSFEIVTDSMEKKEIYDLIRQNREKFGRPIYMTFKDLLDISFIWPVDFFKVSTKEKEIVASAIFYRNNPEISYAVFWGDNTTGRLLRAMDFMAFNLWSYYKNLGFKYIDLGISTELGIPNEGLLRFKETHESTSSLRFRFTWGI
jgi:hypothetical protein